MNNSFSFNGVDLGGTTYGVTCLTPPYEVLAQPRMSTIPRAGGHGAIIRSQFYGEKTITVPCVIEGSGWSDLLTRIDLVRGVLLGDMANDHQLILGWQESRYINARVAGVAMGEEYGTRAMKTEITFIAGDPIWYGVTAKTGTITTNAWYGLDPEHTIPGTPYAGNIETPFSIVATNGPGVPSFAESPNIHNHSYADKYFAGTGTAAERWGAGNVGGYSDIAYYRPASGELMWFDSDNEEIKASMDGITWVSLSDKMQISILNTYTNKRYVCPTNCMVYPPGLWTAGEHQNVIEIYGLYAPGWSATYSYYERWI